MKTLKNTLSVSLVTILSVLILSWSVLTESIKIIDPIASSKSTTPKQNTQRTSKLRIDFWSLVHSGNETKTTYYNLLLKYGKNKNLKAEDKAILSYLKKICEDSETFQKFKSIPKLDRISANKLSDISID